jgi:plastocyanin
MKQQHLACSETNETRSKYMLKSMCIVVSALSILACGGSGGGGGATAPKTPPTGNTPVPAGSNGVSVNNNAFSPADKTVAVGATVQWSWNSCDYDPYGTTSCASHSVTFNDGVASEIQDKGTFSRTFTAAGVYSYHCAVHGTAMSGKITVQ